MIEYYNISLVKVLYSAIKSENSHNKIEGLIINVSEKLRNQLVPIKFLIDFNFSIDLNNKKLDIFKDWTIENKDAKSGNYKITFNNNQEVDEDDYLVVTLKRKLSTCNKLFIDFKTYYDENGESIIENYKITTPGEYYFNIDTIDENKVNIKSDNSYVFISSNNK